MATTNEYLLERVPESLVTLQQAPRVWRYDGSALPTFKFQRFPHIEDLKQFTGLWSIWQANETLILTDRPVGYVEHEKVLYYRDAPLGSMQCMQVVSLVNYDRYFWFRSDSLHFNIMGKSDHAIAETAVFLWSLDDCATFRCIHCNERFNFNIVSSQQLSSLFFHVSSSAKISLSLTNISPAQAECLAQMPYSISLFGGESLGTSLMVAMHLWDLFFAEGHLLPISR